MLEPQKIQLSCVGGRTKRKIPSVNENVLNNYSLEHESREMYGITDKQYELCSWGLLIPDSLEDTIVSAYPEIMMLLNLYSPTFLYPVFYVSDFGITRSNHNYPRNLAFANQNRSAIFKRKSFVSFLKQLLPQSQYGVWQRDRCQKWDDEDWRLFVATLLFSGLQDYDNRKNAFGWQRESADMATILECLFTAGDTQTEEVGYRLRKRAAVLIGSYFGDVEATIKEMYRLRSAFVHGSFFAHIAKQSKRSSSNLPLPDFNLLYRHKEYVRWALIAYLHLARQIQREPTFGRFKTVIDLLEAAIIDIDLRRRLAITTSKLFKLIPKLLPVARVQASPRQKSEKWIPPIQPVTI